MNEYCYLYGIGLAEHLPAGLRYGVDARFLVEVTRCGRLAALSSRVGMDRFDLAKLQEGTADFQWLSAVAVRHNAIICEAAQQGPLLPMRLGVIFQSQASMLAKVARHEARVVDFLRSLGDRREWSVKAYLDDAMTDRVLPSASSQSGQMPDPPGRSGAARGQGTLYLAGRRQKSVRAEELQTVVRHEVVAMGGVLHRLADAWRELRPLPRVLLEHPEKMVWNEAVLLSTGRASAFQMACARFKRELAPKGMLLELSGPWPAYHFCPTLDPEGEDGVAPSVGH